MPRAREKDAELLAFLKLSEAALVWVRCFTRQAHEDTEAGMKFETQDSNLRSLLRSHSEGINSNRCDCSPKQCVSNYILGDIF